MRYRLGVSVWSLELLTIKHSAPLTDLVRAVAGMGAEQVDLTEYYIGATPHPDLHRLVETRRFVESCGLAVGGVWFRTDIVAATHLYSRGKVLADLRRYLAIAAELGARCINVQSGDLVPGMTRAEARDLLLETYREIAVDAERYGVVIGLEVARPFATFNSPVGGLDLVREVGSPYVTLTPDFECWRRPRPGRPMHYAENPDAVQPEPLDLDAFAACLPFTRNMHAKALEFEDDETEPNFPVAEMLAAVAATDGDYDVTLEYEGWIPEVRPDLDPVEQTRRGVSMVRRHLGPGQR